MDISSSGWDKFLTLFGDIPGIFLDYFQIILNFLYVCQSVSQLTLLRKLCQYKDISSSGWGIFLKLFETFLWYFLTISKLFWISCMSGSLVVGSLPYSNQVNTGISLVLDELSLWNLFIHSLDVGTLVKARSDQDRSGQVRSD